MSSLSEMWRRRISDDNSYAEAGLLKVVENIMARGLQSPGVCAMIYSLTNKIR